MREPDLQAKHRHSGLKQQVATRDHRGRENQGPERSMTYDITDLFAQRERDRYTLHVRHLDEQMVKATQNHRL